MPALLHEADIQIVEKQGYVAIVSWNGRKYIVNLDWLRYDKSDRNYYIHLSYLTTERILR